MFKSIIPVYVPGDVSFASPNVGLIPACDILPSKEIRAPLNGFCASPLNLHVIVFGPILTGPSTTQRSALSRMASNFLEQPLRRDVKNTNREHTKRARVLSRKCKLRDPASLRGLWARVETLPKLYRRLYRPLPICSIRMCKPQSLLRLSAGTCGNTFRSPLE